MIKREMDDIKKIIVHCSASDFGDVETIDRWHKEFGWDGCGYHYVITNGIRTKKSKYDPEYDGLIQPGRPITTVGAHCYGHNRDSIGICLIGNHHFTGKQLLSSLPDLLLMFGYIGITSENIYGHCELSKKTCPNIDTSFFRLMV